MPARVSAFLAVAVALLLLAGCARGIALLDPHQSAEVRALNGETYWMDGLRVQTPRDYTVVAPGTPIYTFDSLPAGLPFTQIQQISLHPLQTRWIGSRPDRLEFYPLGSVRREVPPPPNWKRQVDQVPLWQRAQALDQVAHLPYINEAVFCWATPADNDGTAADASVYLFRQGMIIADPDRVVQATLHIASNAELLEVALNEQPLHLSPDRPFRLASYEVTHLLQPGVNILAIRAREKPGTLEPGYGLAFALELLEAPAGSQRPAVPRAGAVLLTRDGDRISGWILDVQGDQIRLRTPFGVYQQVLGNLEAVIFPAGWHPTPPEPGMVERLLPTPQATPAVEQFHGLPLRMEPDPLRNALLLTGSRVAGAVPAYVRGSELFLEGADGSRFSVPLTDVLAFYPPRPVEWTFRRPQRGDADLYCRITTTGGDRISGLLRQFNGRKVVLETEGATFLEFNPDHIAQIIFPYHAPPVAPGRGPVAVIAQAAGQETLREAYLNDVREVQAATFAIDASYESVDPAILSDPARLTPQRYPVLVSVDPAGEYPHTVLTEGDARQALTQYLESGGVLIVLSRGGAFRTALIASEGGFRRSADEVQDPSMASLLNVRTVHPDEVAGETVRAFNHPPNRPEAIVFERRPDVPELLQGLPRSVTLNPMLSARFYPMVSPAGRVVYELRDGSGQSFGPALSLIPKGKGTLVVIDHLLWNSHPDGFAFSSRVLPTLLRWGLELSPQP